MPFSHEKLRVYQKSLQFVAQAEERAAAYGVEDEDEVMLRRAQ